MMMMRVVLKNVQVELVGIDPTAWRMQNARSAI